MEKIEKEGIELLEKLSLTVISVVNEVKEDLKDDKIQTGEMLALVPDVFSLIKQGLNWKGLVAQVVDFSTDEGKKFAQFLIENGVAKDKAGVVITHIAAAAEKIETLYFEDIVPIIDAIKK